MLHGHFTDHICDFEMRSNRYDMGFWHGIDFLHGLAYVLRVALPERNKKVRMNHIILYFEFRGWSWCWERPKRHSCRNDKMFISQCPYKLEEVVHLITSFFLSLGSWFLSLLPCNSTAWICRKNIHFVQLTRFMYKMLHWIMSQQLSFFPSRNLQGFLFLGLYSEKCFSREIPVLIFIFSSIRKNPRLFAFPIIMFLDPIYEEIYTDKSP